MKVPTLALAIVLATPVVGDDDQKVCSVIVTRGNESQVDEALRATCKDGNTLLYQIESTTYIDPFSFAAAYHCDYNYPITKFDGEDSLTCVYRSGKE